MNTLENRVQKTVTYLNSDRGKTNWSLNIGRSYSYEMNMFAAVQTATRLIKYEKIMEIINQVNLLWPAKAKVA